MKKDRDKWFKSRKFMESSKVKNLPAQKKSRKNWDYFFYLIKVFKVFIKISGLKKRGYNNALKIRTHVIEHVLEDLPPEFDNFRVLHLSDLHLDESHMITPKLEKVLENIKADICVMTGDYGTYHPHRKIEHVTVLNRLKAIKDKLNFLYPTYCVLGNHDSCEMVRPMEEMGFKVLINEKAFIHKGNSSIQLIGTDDVHYFFSNDATEILKYAKDKFTITLVHSPEIVDYARDNGSNLYLTGHSHGGQICMPGGVPIITHLKRGKDFKKGLWKTGDMIGYTSNGVGCSALFLRFNCRPEAVIHVLKCQTPSAKR